MFLCLKFVLILANSERPNEMQHVAFHQGLHSFPKNPFRAFQSVNQSFVTYFIGTL